MNSKMNYSIRSFDVICVIISILLVLLTKVYSFLSTVLAVWLLVYIVLKMFKTKNSIFLVIELFILMYSIIPLFYFFKGIYIAAYQPIDLDHYQNMLAVLQIQSIFNVFFFSFAPLDSDFNFSKYIKPINNIIAWFATFALMIFSLAFVNWQRVSSFFRGTYSIETESSIIFDYFMIFAISNCLFCDKRWKKILNISLSILVAAVCLLLGKRLTAITNLLLIYILYFDGKFKKKTILGCFIVGTISMNSIQYLRIGKMPSLLNALTGLHVENGVFRSNPGDVWYASEVIYKLIDNNTFDWSFRIKSFIGTFLNSFLTTSLTPKEALVNIYITDNNLFPYTANGGFIGVSTYLWFGYFSVVLFAVIISKIIKRGFEYKSMFITLYSVLVLATFPRWYTYNPRILFKFAFVAIVVYLFTLVISCFGNRKGISKGLINE